MKITKFLIALGTVCAIIIWASSSSCSSKDLTCSGDASFSAVSNVLITECDKCHKDSSTAAMFGKGIVIKSNDSASVVSFISTDKNGGLLLADLEGTGLHLMPLRGPKLSDCEINTVRNWINNLTNNAAIPCNDSTFASASKVLVASCNKCHSDSITASNFGKGIVINSLDSNAVLNFTSDPTMNLPLPASYGVLVQDIEGIAPVHTMPLGGAKISDCNISAIKSWIWFHYTH